MKLLTVVALSLLIFSSFALAQEDGESVSETVLSSRDIETGVVFPDHPDTRVAAGDVVEVLVGITNHGRKTYNITSLYAYLKHPEHGIYVQNFTRWGYFWNVPPQTQVTFSYKFLPDSGLNGNFTLVANVDYSDDEFNNYTTTFYNSTIQIYEEDSFDVSLIFVYIFLLAGIGAFVFFIFSRVGKKSKKSKHSGESANRPESREDLLAGTNLEYMLKSSARGSPRLSKKTQ